MTKQINQEKKKIVSIVLIQLTADNLSINSLEFRFISSNKNNFVFEINSNFFSLVLTALSIFIDSFKVQLIFMNLTHSILLAAFTMSERKLLHFKNSVELRLFFIHSQSITYFTSAEKTPNLFARPLNK